MKTLALRKVGIVLAGGLALFAIQNAAVAGIEKTRHNLSTSSTHNKFTSNDGMSEICAFCHTPHGADTKAPAPLWNRSLGSKGEAYQTYNLLGTSTLDGAVAPVGSVSLACLSCHDGTQAMNTLINQPGSGNYNADGHLWKGKWEIPEGSAANSDGIISKGIPYIGTDLKNDHPVGIQYGGGGFTVANNLNQTSPKQAVGTPIDSDFVTPYVKSDDKKAVFWVETGGASTGRQKTDLILYTRNEAGISGGAQPFVECASCHDPHVSDTKTFLRISNQSSALCLACHTK